MRFLASCVLLGATLLFYTYRRTVPSTLKRHIHSMQALSGSWKCDKDLDLEFVPNFTGRHRSAPQATFSDPIPFPNSSSQCTRPIVRKEWRAMTDMQREGWITACLTKLPRSGRLVSTVNATDPIDINPPINVNGSWYDDFSYVHMDLNTRIHQTGLFLPWHRYFLWSFEQSLSQHCNYTGFSPYWDWTQDATDFQNATIIADSDPKTGLGGFGSPALDGAVLDGAFAGLQLAYPSPHVLRREYTPFPFLNLTPPLFTDNTAAAVSAFTQDEVETMVGGFKGDFKGFQSYIEAMQGAHMSVHMIIGGDLGGTCPRTDAEDCMPDAKWSPNEPLFWLHHAMVDKVWWDWQHAHADNFWAFEAGTVRDLDTWPRHRNGAPPSMTPEFILPKNGILIGNYSVQDMFNTTSNGPLCYVYE